MASEAVFEEINEAKVNLNDIYDRPDPRAYYRALEGLRYAIPGAAKPVFQRLIAHLQQDRDEAVRILDLGCSYGVNAALLRYNLSMPELFEHWGQDELTAVPSEEVVAHDQRYFANLHDAGDIEMIGLDPAENAVDFATEVGLLDQGIAANLETEPLPAPAQATLAEVDMVASTGCVGYVTEKTFERLLPAVSQGRSPWIANFVLRMFPFAPIEAALSNWGYVTEKLDGRTFVQRRFATPGEQAQVLDQLREQGIDPDGKETQGHLLAEFYLSRPAREVAVAPLATLIPA